MMIKEQLFEDLYDKLPDVGNFVIFGACAAGEKILKEQLANNNSTLNSPNSKLDIY